MSEVDGLGNIITDKTFIIDTDIEVEYQQLISEIVVRYPILKDIIDTNAIELKYEILLIKSEGKFDLRKYHNMLLSHTNTEKLLQAMRNSGLNIYDEQGMFPYITIKINLNPFITSYFKKD